MEKWKNNVAKSSTLIDKQIKKQSKKSNKMGVKRLEMYIERIRRYCLNIPLVGAKQLRNNKCSGQTFNSKLIDIVNDFHARCICCNHHFYAKSFAEDQLSYFLCHINSFEHRLNLPFLPEDEPAIKMCGKNEWMCEVCDEFLTPQTIDLRTLTDEINYHLDSFAHQHNAMLMTDSESALLVALSFLPYFRNKIVNSKCTICDSQLCFTVEDHLKFTMHLHNLKKYIMENFNFDLKNYDDKKRKLLKKIWIGWKMDLMEVETKIKPCSANNEIRLLSVKKETTGTQPIATSTPHKRQKNEISSSSKCSITNELKIGIKSCSVSDELPKVVLSSKIEDLIMAVRKEVWKDSLKPHPGSVYARSASVLENDFDSSIYDIVNDIHAYCIPCQMHLYSTFSDEDITSYCSNHVNLESHLFNLQDFKENNIFYLKSKEEIFCRVCSCIVPIIRIYSCNDLRTIIGKHDENRVHIYNVNRMTDPDISLLVSLAFIPYFKNFVIDLECKLCSKKIKSKYKVKNHLKSKIHINCLKEFLNSIFHLEPSSLSCDVTLKNLFEKMVKLEQCFGTKARYINLSVKQKLIKSVEILIEAISEIDDKDIKWLLCENVDEVKKIVENCFSQIPGSDCSPLSDSQLIKTGNEMERPIGSDGNKTLCHIQERLSVTRNSKPQNPVPHAPENSTAQNPVQQKQALLMDCLVGKPFTHTASMDNTTQNLVQQKHKVSENFQAQSSVQHKQTVLGGSEAKYPVQQKQTVLGNTTAQTSLAINQINDVQVCKKSTTGLLDIQNKWKNIVHDIKTNSSLFETYGPHLKTVIKPVRTVLREEFKIHFIHVINDYHAFCLLCQKQLYSRADRTDLYSYFMAHLNSKKHLSKVESHPFEDDVLVMKSQNNWTCVPCQIGVQWQNIRQVSLKDIIENHLKEKEHKAYKIPSYDFLLHSTLIGLSITDVFYMKFIVSVGDDWKCRLCSVDILSGLVFGHLKSPQHLMNVISYIKNTFNVVSLEMILDDQALANVLEMTAQDIQKS